jgi:hypothetical protein
MSQRDSRIVLRPSGQKPVLWQKLNSVMNVI